MQAHTNSGPHPRYGTRLHGQSPGRRSAASDILVVPCVRAVHLGVDTCSVQLARLRRSADAAHIGRATRHGAVLAGAVTLPSRSEGAANLSLVRTPLVARLVTLGYAEQPRVVSTMRCVLKVQPSASALKCADSFPATREQQQKLVLCREERVEEL